MRRRSFPVPSRALKLWIVIAVFAPNIVGRGRMLAAPESAATLHCDRRCNSAVPSQPDHSIRRQLVDS